MDRKSNQIPLTVALVPARSGSKRIPDKNIRVLAGYPLIAYTIASAIQSEIFDAVIVSTDSEHYAHISRYYGAQVPFLRPPDFAGDLSPDIEWVEYTLGRLRDAGKTYDCFSILRPTSPFRQPDTIRRAYTEFLMEPGVDSLRAVEKCTQHPGKMWIVDGKRMEPLLPSGSSKPPWHSSQYPSLPEIYVQNASLEIAWTRVVFEDGTISGNVLVPFFTTGWEGFDINHDMDWILANHLIQNGRAALPHIPQAPYAFKKDPD